jgi:hypothetical protein
MSRIIYNIYDKEGFMASKVSLEVSQIVRCEWNEVQGELTLTLSTKEKIKFESPEDIARIWDIIHEDVEGAPSGEELTSVEKPAKKITVIPSEEGKDNGRIIIIPVEGEEYSLDGQNWEKQTQFNFLPPATYFLYTKTGEDIETQGIVIGRVKKGKKEEKPAAPPQEHQH